MRIQSEVAVAAIARRVAAIALALSISGSAFAGGLGILATGGAHTERVYYYSNADEDGNPFKDLSDYTQFHQDQFLPNLGAGLDLMLGDRDDKIVGDAQLYWMM